MLVGSKRLDDNNDIIIFVISTTSSDMNDVKDDDNDMSAFSGLCVYPWKRGMIGKKTSHGEKPWIEAFLSSDPPLGGNLEERCSSVPSCSNKQIKKGFTTTTDCDDNDTSFLISRFRKNPEEGRHEDNVVVVVAVVVVFAVVVVAVVVGVLTT